MNGYLRKFLIINEKIIDPKNKEIKVVIADRSRFQDCLINASFGSAFCKKHEANALIISDKKNEVYRSIYESCGYTKFFEGLKVENFFSFIFLKTLLISIIIFFIDLFKIYFKGFDWFIRDYKIESIPLGDLIYNTYVRYDHSYLKKCPDIKFTRILLSVIIKFKIFSHFFKKYKIKYVLAKGGPYASSNGILFRLASCRNIKIVKLEVLPFSYRVSYSIINKFFNLI